MPLLYMIGGIVALALLGYLMVALQNRSCSDDIQRDSQLLLYMVVLIAGCCWAGTWRGSMVRTDAL
jgi:hypothetical protein